MHAFRPNGIVTLLTDFGPDSFYVAEMKGAILGIASEANLVDVTHGVAPQGVREGSWKLLRAVEAFPEGTIHVAVVDPGVGTNRPILIAKIAGQVVIGPDNGLLEVVAARHTPADVWRVKQDAFPRAKKFHTFHGRDIMGPAAAYLANGKSPDGFGERLPVAAIIGGGLKDIFARREGEIIRGKVVYRDRFGNLITNIMADELPPSWQPQGVTVTCGDIQVRGLVRTYSEAKEGRWAALWGSSEQLELAIVRGNAAEHFGTWEDAEVTLTQHAD